MRSGLLLLACCTALAGCGGGGSGGGGVSVVANGITPTPTPSPTPTPAPTATLNTGEIKPTSDATFIAATMEMTTAGDASSNLNGGTGGGTTSDRSTMLDTAGFTASYSPTTGYKLADLVNAATFGPAELKSDTTGSDPTYPTVLFSKIAYPTEDYLALYKVVIKTSSSTGPVTLSPQYGGLAGWQHTVVQGGARRTRLDYFAFGPATPISGMPRSGIVKFMLVGSGNYAGDHDLYFTTAVNILTVDFGAGTVTGVMTAGGQNLFNGNVGGLYAVRPTGMISGNGLTGKTDSDVAVATGQFRLLFVGPNADEMIVTIVGQDGRGSYVSSMVGVRNPYL